MEEERAGVMRGGKRQKRGEDVERERGEVNDTKN